MDKICYRNPSKSEVIGRCGYAEPTKVERLKNRCIIIRYRC